MKLITHGILSEYGNIIYLFIKKYLCHVLYRGEVNNNVGTLYLLGTS